MNKNDLYLLMKEGSLEKWIANVIQTKSGLAAFAKGIISDFEAVNNAVITPYSNGPVEGHVNRLKISNDGCTVEPDLTSCVKW